MNKKRFVLLVGGASGIGESCLRMLLHSGYHVIATVTSETKQQMLKQKYASKNLRVLVMDLTNPDEIWKAYETAKPLLEKTGLYGIINSAGIVVGGPLEYLPLAEIREAFEVNLFGFIRVVQAFLPLIRKGRGRLVILSSMAGRWSPPYLGPYTMSKFALEAFCNSLRIELMPWKIPITVIGPGMIRTPIWNTSMTRVKETFHQLPEQGQEMYRTSFSNVVNRLLKLSNFSLAPEKVAQKVLRILQAKRPKNRYIIGPDARMMEMVISLPARWRDRIIFHMLRVSPKREMEG